MTITASRGWLKMMRLGLDLRGLNYAPRTGVNTYTLHFLYQLHLELRSRDDVSVTAVGLRPERLRQLESEFPWLRGMFAEQLSLAKYLGLPEWLSRIPAIGRQTFLLNGLLAVCNLAWPGLNYPGAKTFDLLFMPQPKPLLKAPGTRLAVMIHDVYGALDGNLLAFLENLKEGARVYRRLLDGAERVWVNSMSTGLDVQKFFGCPESKIKLVYLALPEWSQLTSENTDAGANDKLSGKMNPIPRLSPGSYFMALSGIEPRKNWHNLLLAHGALQKRFPDYDLDLVLCGVPVNPGYLRQLQDLIAAQDIQRVHFIFDPDNQLKFDLLRNCLFLAYPSFYEGFGFPILEALNAGKAVLTGNISSMPEIAREAGLYVNPFNYEDIAAGLRILQTDSKFRSELEISGRNSLELYSWDELRRAIRDLLNKVSSI